MNTKVIKNCNIGERTVIHDFVNLYGCTIGNDCIVGTFVEIQKNVQIGSKVKIQSHTFICEGVTLADEVFIGHHVVFINDNHPASVNEENLLKKANDWQLQRTLVQKGASIGSNATILGGITVGAHAIIGAGSVVTKDVLPGITVAGNPARQLKSV